MGRGKLRRATHCENELISFLSLFCAAAATVAAAAALAASG